MFDCKTLTENMIEHEQLNGQCFFIRVCICSFVTNINEQFMNVNQQIRLNICGRTYLSEDQLKVI